MITNPPLKYLGSKWRIAQWVVSHFPPHLSYIEPCGGGASVLLNKSPSRYEVYNDVDEAVVTFFRVLREQRDQLVEAIQLTPFSESEYRLSFESSADDLEIARRVYCRAWMSWKGYTDRPSGFPIIRDPNQRVIPHAQDFYRTDNLICVERRLRGVNLLNRDALDIIARFIGVEETLIYLDPPYLHALRGSHRYPCEWSPQDHIDAASMLRAHNGPVVISGYPSALYSELYEDHGWQRVGKVARTNGEDKTESLWLNPAAQRPTLFEGMGGGKWPLD